MADANRLPPDVRRFFCVLTHTPQIEREKSFDLHGSRLLRWSD